MSAPMLPCPFCGGPMTPRGRSASWGDHCAQIANGCKTCGYSLPGHDVEGWTPERGHFSTETEAHTKAYAAWNRRSSTVPRLTEQERGAVVSVLIQQYFASNRKLNDFVKWALSEHDRQHGGAS